MAEWLKMMSAVLSRCVRVISKLSRYKLIICINVHALQGFGFTLLAHDKHNYTFHKYIIIEKNLESILNQDVVIVSGAGDAYISKGSWGSSYIRNLNSNTQINLKRGLNLIGLNKMGNPILLDRVDTCNTLNRQAFQDSDYFRKIMDDNSDLYDIFVIITHETAVCGNFNLGLLFSGSGLTQWKNIKFREPYIGMIMNDKEIIEYNGEKVIKLEIQ